MLASEAPLVNVLQGGQGVTKKIGKFVLIEKENAQQCDYCGKIAELRPYGKNGACICYDCAMKDEATTKTMFARRINVYSIETVRAVFMPGTW